jgi:hypothetical protein
VNNEELDFRRGDCYENDHEIVIKIRKEDFLSDESVKRFLKEGYSYDFSPIDYIPLDDLYDLFACGDDGGNKTHPNKIFIMLLNDSRFDFKWAKKYMEEQEAYWDKFFSDLDVDRGLCENHLDRKKRMIKLIKSISNDYYPRRS